jgi:hypothetical protein
MGLPERPGRRLEAVPDRSGGVEAGGEFLQLLEDHDSIVRA